MKFGIATTLVAAACTLAFNANAAIFTFTGNTSGALTYNRPLEDLSGLSAIGTNVRYSTFAFSVNVTGDYTAITTGMFDTFLTLYSGSFNPAAPLTNAIVANDDLIPFPFTTSGFAETLTAGTTYILVNTGYSSTDFGAFSTTIGGPGAITVVPEPAAYALFGLGLAVIGLRRRRQLAAND